MSDAAPTADTAGATTEPATADVPTSDDTDWKAEAEKWSALAKKHEGRAKSNAEAAKELEEFRRQSMTDQEKAVADARAAARAEALTEAGTKVAAAELRAAAAGRMTPEQVDVLLDGLNVARFLDENGDVDRAALVAFIDGIAPASEEKRNQLLDLGQGTRSTSTTPLNGDPLLRDLKNLLGPPRR